MVVSVVTLGYVRVEGAGSPECLARVVRSTEGKLKRSSYCQLFAVSFGEMKN